jgi:hypothetical protein
MAIDSHVVRLAIEYLDNCVANGSPATLVGMHWYIDGRNKTLPLRDEVNAALSERPSLGVKHVEGRVVFTTGGKLAVTNEDMRHADKQYRREFDRKLRKLKE